MSSLFKAAVVDHRLPTFYVSATLSEINPARQLMDAIEAQGYAPTFRWGPVDLTEYRAQSQKEIKAVRGADLFVMLLPGRLGSATELGAALMRAEFLPTQIVLWAPDDATFNGGVEGISSYPNVFWHHPDVEWTVGKDPVESVLRHLFGKLAC